jgi:signal peptidase II
MNRTLRTLLLLAAAIFVLDQATKFAVVEAMDLIRRQRIELWPGVLSFVMAWNRGINFGVLASDLPAMRWLLAGLAVAISVGVAVWAMRRAERWFTLGAGLLIGGALGNAVDRVRWGAVADFLNVSCCGIVNPYAFNVADVAIFGGALVLAFAPSPQPAERAAEGRGR